VARFLCRRCSVSAAAFAGEVAVFRLGESMLTFFVYEQAHWRAIERAWLEL
jgi:hypothetical protein